MLRMLRALPSCVRAAATSRSIPLTTTSFRRLVVHHQPMVRPALRGYATPPSPQPSASQRSIFSEMLFYSPIQVLAGLALGGLGATCAAIVYFLHLQEVIDAKDVLTGLQKYRLVLEQDGTLDIMTGEATTKRTSPWVSIPIAMMAPACGWALMFFITSSMAWTRARFRLQLREHMRQVNFSLTVLRNNTLKLRTLRETTLEHIMPENQAAIDLVLECARRTTEEQPFLALPRNQNALILNSVLNELAPVFSDGYVREEMGLPVRSERYWIGVSFRHNTSKARKLRVIVTSERLLRNLPTMEMPDLEHPDYATRWRTLKAMAELYHKQNINGNAGIEGPGSDCVIQLHPIVLSVPIT
eukprot:TRINITY_DN8530_c0_g1_i4.p1 TRINITY_DN8530_c0_g1~~TRINITY_DN8530_c0_g1_i4.p1  ORF type:complete len:357 (+),score=75.01 TRINITY_DN8530_c0_g1_i4:63-1133(+)